MDAKRIIISRTDGIGDVVLALPVAGVLRSDMAFLYPAVSLLFPFEEALHFLRDATRGGVAAVLNEAVQGAAVGIRMEEAEIPVSAEVQTVADLLGLNPLEIANEGVFIAVVDAGAEAAALRALRSHPLGRSARVIGHVSRESPGTVLMTTRIGGTRRVDFPRGLLLPRIC